MSERKSMLITLGITFLLFSFIILLIYLVYCYAYYDENQINIYTDKFNTGNSKYIYDNMFNDSNLTYDDFLISYNLMYDKNTLKNIYYLYYKDNKENSDISGLETFIKTYYYGNKRVNKDNIEFQTYGKTNLFHRMNLDYKKIEVNSIDGYKSTLGLIKNVTILKEDKSRLSIDGKTVNCDGTECIIKNIFGGLHTIKYKSNNIDYYGIINVIRDDQRIDVTTLDSLVTIGNKVIQKEEEPIINAELDIGEYKLSDCYLDTGCPSSTKSYLNLHEDGTVDYYTYVTLDIAGDTYHGTYEVIGNFLVLKFASHTYRVHDYDTNKSTDIEGTIDMQMRFKIENRNTIRNDSYQFQYSAE